jgi:hypothetical protein
LAVYSQHQLGPGTPDCPVVHRTVSGDLGELTVNRLLSRNDNYKSPDCPVVHRTVRWCTGPSGESSATNSSLSGQEKGDVAIIHLTVRWCTGLSGEPTAPVANGRPRDQRATRGSLQRSAGCTGLSGVHRTTVRCTNRSRGAMVGCARYGRRSRTGHKEWLSGGAPDCPMHHSTEGKDGLPN